MPERARTLSKTASRPDRRGAGRPWRSRDREREWAAHVLDSVGDLFCVLEDGRIAYVNEAGARLLGHRSGRPLIDRPFAEFLEDDSQAAFGRLIAEGATNGPVRLRVKPKRGGATEIEARAVVLDEADGRALVLQARSRGRPIEPDAAAADRDGRLRLASKIIDTMGEGVAIADADFRVVAANPAFGDHAGRAAAELIGRPPTMLRALRDDAESYAGMQRALARTGHWSGEVWHEAPSGERRPLRLSVAAIAEDEASVGDYAIVVHDTPRTPVEDERFHYQANHDALTGLPNRTLFLDRLNQTIAGMTRSKRKFALIVIDLDGFKLVNDTFGHDVGDTLLREAARRLAACVRAADTIARLGGDEFTVIARDLADATQAAAVAQRLLDALNAPFALDGEESYVSGSIGVAMFPDDARGASDLLRSADAAMYRAKETGKAGFQFFTTDLNDRIKERLALKNGLSKALERAEFSLHYQPKLEIASGRITGVEALMRWNNADLGAVSPVRFIPVMEETGLVVEVGEWAIRTACEQHLAWRRMGLPPLRVAVNLSARQLREAAFVDVVARVLAETGVAPDGLEFEITESMLMTDAENAVVALGTLHDMGIHIAMDDFGTGYSSLSYLKRFPIDTIKIDRSFVADIATNPDDAEIIRTIITMGQTLNRRVVAEGVETERQMSLLRDYRCDEIQGYLLSPPLPADGATRFLAERADAVAPA